MTGTGMSCFLCGDNKAIWTTHLCGPCWRLGLSFDSLMRRHPDKARAWLRAQAGEPELETETEIALRESVKLQSHYAELLNQQDGGERLSFPTTEAWIARLKEMDETK